MRRYLHLHLDFLLSRVVVWVIIISILVSQVAMLYASNINEGYEAMDAYRQIWGRDYLNESLMIYEFVSVFLSIYIAMQLGSRNNTALMHYSVVSKRTKFNFVSARLMSGIMVLCLVYSISSMSLYIYTSSFSPYDIFLESSLSAFFRLYLEMLQYYILTFWFMLLFGHMLMGLLSFLLFWILEIMDSMFYDQKLELFEKITINVKSIEFIEKNILIFSFLYIFLIICYIILLMKKDC